MKKIITIIALVSAAFVASAQDKGIYTLVSGGTNNLATPATNTYTTSVAVSDHSYVGLHASFTVNGSDANALTNRITLRVYDTVDGSNWNNVAPLHTFLITPTSSNVVFTTNFFIEGRAAIGKIKLESTNALATSYSTNVIIKVRHVDPRVDAR